MASKAGLQGRNWIVGTIVGLFLLFVLYAIAGLIVYGTGILMSQINGNLFIFVWLWGFSKFFVLQFFYVLPVTWMLSRGKRWAVVTGLWTGALITAFLNSTAILIFEYLAENAPAP